MAPMIDQYQQIEYADYAIPIYVRWGVDAPPIAQEQKQIAHIDSAIRVDIRRR